MGLRVADEDLGGNCVAFCDMVDITCESEDDDCIYRAYGCITFGPSSLDTCDVFCWFADADCHDEDCMIHCSWADDDEEDEPVDSCETTCYQLDEDCLGENCEEHCFLDSEECLNDNLKEPLEPELLTTVQFNYTARFGCEKNFGWCCEDVSTGGLGINCMSPTYFLHSGAVYRMSANLHISKAIKHPLYSSSPSLGSHLCIFAKTLVTYTMFNILLVVTSQ